MHVVRATNPPSMTVVLDTILLGDMILAVPQAHAEFHRIDLVVVDALLNEGWKTSFDGINKLRSRVRYVTANVQMGPNGLIAPLPSGVRVLAKVYVHPGAPYILQRNIEEVELHGQR